MKNIYKKIHAFNSEVGAIEKNSTNPHFKYKYADINAYLEVILPVLNKSGLVLVQPLNTNDKGELVLSSILADIDSEEELKSVIVLPTNIDSQKQGAIITYFRRFAIQSFLALQAEDNDANNTTTQQQTDPVYSTPQQSTTSYYPKGTTNSNETSMLCSACQSVVPEKVYNYSTQKLGKALCFSCQKKGEKGQQVMQQPTTTSYSTPQQFAPVPPDQQSINLEDIPF